MSHMSDNIWYNKLELVAKNSAATCSESVTDRDSGNINDDRKNILLHTAVKSLKTVSKYLYRKVCIQERLG
jgi:hypothetical protein